MTLLLNWKKIHLLTCFVLACSALGTCFHNRLKQGAGQVQVLYQNDDTGSCSTISRIDTGSRNPRTFQDGQIILRNAAFDMGANAIQIKEFRDSKIAIALALKCPQKVLDAAYERNAQQESHAIRTESNNGQNASNQTNSHNQNSNNTQTNPNPGTASISGENVSYAGQTWQRCSYGQFLASNHCQGTAATIKWAAAAKYCKELKHSGRNWRLPSLEELRKIGHAPIQNQPAIDMRLFPGTHAGLYWSSSFYQKSPNVVWSLDFRDRKSFAFGTGNKAYVRCVAE